MPNGHITRRVIVKFHDTVDIPYEDGAERHVMRLGIGPWDQLARRFKGIRLNRLFTVMPAERIGELTKRARERSRRYRPANLLSYFVIESPAGVDPRQIVEALREREWEQVETAYVDPLDKSPAPPGTNPFFAQQTYLKPPATAAEPAPQGAIDAEFAWTQPGGTGTSQKIIDLERGAKLDQEDIVGLNIGPQLHGINNPDFFDRLHGAQVLCIVAAMDNNKGVIGIAHGVQEVKYTCQVINNMGQVDRPNAVLAAINHFTQPGEDPVGRVLLLEVEIGPTNDPVALTDVNGDQWNGMPMETAQADYDAIRLATGLGITVVEAAGNGNNNLDNFQQAGSGQFVLQRPGGRDDSGAIMVGGSTWNFPYQRLDMGFLGGSCFGSRVDCFAWAENVMTYDNFFGMEGYTSDFGGTSAASAIVAGAALLVQSVAEAKLGHRLDAEELRDLLADKTPGVNTPSNNPPVDLIGVMPNLKRIIQDKLGDKVAPSAPTGIGIR
ncbi:MAG TPA: S8 family serine peptidase [Methylomirabilota bacterium]|nr:S8 family serine peptidase [Methylomirabilota bacterium]